MHCLLGENGAGKSTLMSILSGMVQPDAGEIRIDGARTRIDSPKHAIELGIGMVYQHTTLVPTLTVLENLMLGDGRSLRLDERGARARLAELAARSASRSTPTPRPAPCASASSSRSRSSRRSGAARRC